MNEQKRIIEINGVKFEVDTREMKQIDKFQVGDRIKVLTKEYQDSFKVHSGVIVGFTLFESLPTVTVAYIDTTYGTSNLKFLHYNIQSKDVEIAFDYDEALEINKSEIVGQLDREIEKKQAEIKEVEREKAYFLKHFKMYFSEIKEKK